MGFYGNITDRSRTHFQFDKIFANRKTMDELVELGLDGIFAGRFVLVKYDPESKFFEGDVLLGYYREGVMYQDSSYSIPYTFTTFTKVTNPVSTNWNQYYYFNGNYYFRLPSQDFYDAAMADRYYTADNNSSSAVALNQLVRIYGTNNLPTQTYYRCTGTANGSSSAAAGETATWEIISYDYGETDYLRNYNIDKVTYGNDFDVRGYDATVWQKIYSEGKGKFILIAFLNGVMPAFELYPSPPAILPQVPYIDSLSSDALYRIHVPSHWGFRIKEAEDPDDSDERITQTYYTFDANNQVTGAQDRDIDADIYFNKDGFIARVRGYDNTTQNEILIEPTGESGKIYVTSEGEQFTIDTYELSIHLPVLGNLVSDAYDLIYGYNPVNEDGEQTRPLDINWYQGNQTELKTRGDSSLGGKSYDLSTIAGTLNTMHTRLGQIIVNLPTKPEAAILSNYSTDYIYYVEDEDKYYRVAIGYTYSPPDESIFDYELATDVVSSETYISDTYYTKSGNTYSPATTGYVSGTNYYKKYIRNIMYEEIEGGLEPYQPGQYFLINGTDYIRDNASQPSAPNRQYYTIDETTPNRTSYSGRTYFSGQYSPGNYYYNDGNDNYLVDMNLQPTPERVYVSLGGTYAYRNGLPVVFYQPNVFYYKDGTGVYKRSGYATYDAATAALGINTVFYWLEFEDEPIVTQYIDDQGIPQTLLAYPLKEAHAVNNMVAAPDAAAQDYLFFVNTSGNYIAYKNIITQSDNSGTPIYAIPRVYTVVGDIQEATHLYVTGKYFVLNGNNDYILSFDNLNRNETYYLIDEVVPVPRPFYIPDTYYYESTTNIFEKDLSERWTSGRVYYDKIRLFVTSDYSGRCPYGYEWSDYALYIPASIILQTREEKLVMFEIEDFANGETSINGYLLKLENNFAPGNLDTRDASTFRGALNTLQDYLYTIGRLIPDRMLYVNSFGQITSSSIKYSDLKRLTDNVDAILNSI